MVQIVKAGEEHVEGIVDICTRGNQAAYQHIYTQSYLELVIKEFYNPERILEEVTHSSRDWGGYFAAIENGKVAGACGGGMISDKAGEVYVLYLDPDRRGEGIGTKLLEVLTKQQKEEFGAVEQWVSVQKGNNRGIPFYEARGFHFQREEKGYGSEEAASYVSLRYSRPI
ncbi:GNAT family N-acetyltransferase [Halobacillus litoralis]|uniref:GNAT family N-acetyltransferase n=1 Tax=Halobacillus litoralis TaxID=45668 RepID=UPI001CFD4A0B|nr:GNAT family N-acetyltransferase [Halobacillus litoralis]